MSISLYMDGSLYVAVTTGMPEASAKIGVGDTIEEAVDSLEATAVQSTGRDGGVSGALAWAHGAGWISDPDDLDECDDDDHETARRALDGLTTGADTEHESAEDMWSSLGWHADWHADHEAGAVVHPACTIEQLDSLDDSEILAAECPEDACEEERGAYESAIAYARRALDDMRSVESALAEAVDAYAEGDARACREALDQAARLEDDYGDCPAARDLREKLLRDP